MKPKAKVHSMKRRCFCHDYYERGIYMITLEVEGRRPILGELVGERGAVLVSPCISPGEKEIARAALADGLPLIVLLENGFAPKFKPSGRYFDACANGKLLMLAPWPHHFEKRTITRAQCLALNAMAQEICGPGAAACDYCGAVPIG